MKVINIFGGPGVGKTTQAHDLFVHLKKSGYNTDIIPEYAKKLVYRNNIDILEHDQQYIFSKQLHEYRIREKSGVEIAISESPLPLSIVYNRITLSEDFKSFENFVWHEFNKYKNLNIFLKRETEYQTIGRTQSEDVAKTVDSVVSEVIRNLGCIEMGLEGFVEKVIKML
jgi:2-phosphoglycerate kinase